MSDIKLFPVRKKWNEHKQKWMKLPKVAKGQHWADYSGSVEGEDNIGIVVPAGVVVFDLDTHKGVDRAQVESVLACTLDWSHALLQRTVSGGEHYAFLCSDALPQGSDLLGVVGFDTRTSGRGWICSGDGYEDMTIAGVVETITDKDLPELPLAAVNKLVAWSSAAQETSDLLEVIAAEPLDIDSDAVALYMQTLPASDAYDNWCRVGMALHHQFSGGEEGLRLWDDWSKRSNNYDAQEVSDKWKSFAKRSRVNPITFATVIKQVRDVDGGAAISSALAVTIEDEIAALSGKQQLSRIIAKVASASLTQIDTQLITKKLAKKATELTGEKFSAADVTKLIKQARSSDEAVSRKEARVDFVDDYVFLTQTGEFYKRETKERMKSFAFDTLHTRETPTNDGEPQRASIYAAQRIECVYNDMYAPMFADMFTHCGVSYVNSYREPHYKPVAPHSGIVERVKAHINHIIEDEREQQIFTYYLAHNVQHLGVKIPWSIVLQGVQGDGKSFFAEMMLHVLGGENVRLLNVQTLESAFTGWAAGQCMSFIEELKLDNYRKYEVLNNLKPYITNPTIEVTNKGKDPRNVLNTTNYIALTNFRDAIPIDTNDRRYCIIFSRWQSSAELTAFIESNKDYYPSLYTAMRAGFQEIAHWLKNMTIPQWFYDLNRAPETTAKNTMIELSKSDVSLQVENAITHFSCNEINDHVVNVTLLSKLAAMEFDEFPKTNALKHALESLGYVQVGRYRDHTKQLNRVYAKDAKFDPQTLSRQSNNDECSDTV